MNGPPQIKEEIKIPKDTDLPSKTHRFSDNLTIDFLLLTVNLGEFLSCFHFLQNPKRYYGKGLGNVYIGQMGDDDDEDEEQDKKLSVALMKYDMGSSAGGSAMVVKNAVTTLRPKGVFSVGLCTGLNANKAKLGDVVVASKLVTYAPVKITDDGRQRRSTIFPLSKHLNDIMRHAGDGWKPPLKDSKEAGKVVGGVILSGPELVNGITERNALLKDYPDAIAIEMEGEGVYTAAQDVQIEWIVVKGISDYADGTKIDTKDWQPYASLMAASVVANILSIPAVFEDWHHYGGTSKMNGPPQIKEEIKIPKDTDLPSKTHRFSDNLTIDFLLLTVNLGEFLSCFHFLQNPKRYYGKGLGNVYIGQMGDNDDEDEEQDKKLSVALMKCDMGSSAGGTAMVVKNAVTTLRPKGVFSVGLCTGLNANKAKLGDVVVASKLVAYAPVKITDDGRQRRGTIVPLSKHLNDIMRHAGDGWKPPLKDSKEAGKVVGGVILSGRELVHDVTERNALLKDYPDAIAIEMEGEGVYTIAHDVQIEWIVVKGISDYADGTKTDTKDWQPYASLMAASVVANILSSPAVFEEWHHYGGAPAQLSVRPSKRARTEPSSSSNSNQVAKVKDGPVSDVDRETLAKELLSHWQALGRRLKIIESVLKGFQRNGLEYPEYSDKALAMLMKWQEREGRAATYRVLYDALCHKNVQRRDLAENICRE